ncbi:hypothetical protein [Psychrobacter sp. TB15]
MVFIFLGFSKITGYAGTADYMESMGVSRVWLKGKMACGLSWHRCHCLS